MRNKLARVLLRSCNKGDEVKEIIRSKRFMAMLLTVAIIMGSFGSLSASAQRRYYRHRGTHHSRAKGALIGGTAGLIGGALIGGGKGALIGAGAGAGTGYLIQRHRNNRRHRYHWRR
jgi:osmotically inducible lipoprotein OsmB